MQPIERPAVQRFDAIDILRGVSILLVILLHLFIRLHSQWSAINALLPAWLSHLLFRNGDNGVTVFFAVSGFLITFTSIKRFGSLGGMRPLAFYRIRFARIVPLLLLLLAVLSVLHLAHAEGFRINLQRESLPGALFSALTFHLNLYEAQHGYLPANWDILWSLSVEEMFYLFFPIVCFILLRWRRGVWGFVALLLVFVAMGPFAREVWTKNPIWRDDTYLGGMDAITMGCLTALLVARMQRSAISPRLLLLLQTVGTLLLFWIFLWPSWSWLYPAISWISRHGVDGSILPGSILPLGTCLVIFGSVLRNRPGRAWTTPVRWYGRHSYEIYMTHEFIVVLGAQLYMRTKTGPLWLWVVAMLLLTAPLGWFVSRFFSEPMNRRLR